MHSGLRGDRSPPGGNRQFPDLIPWAALKCPAVIALRLGTFGELQRRCGGLSRRAVDHYPDGSLKTVGARDTVGHRVKDVPMIGAP